MSHWPPGAHTSTFMGNAVNLAAGRAAIGVFREERLADRSAALGARTSSGYGPRSRTTHTSARSAASACSSASRSSLTGTPRPRRRNEPRAIRRRRVRAWRAARWGRPPRERHQGLPAAHHRGSDLLDAAVDLTIDAIKGAR